MTARLIRRQLSRRQLRELNAAVTARLHNLERTPLMPDIAKHVCADFVAIAPASDGRPHVLLVERGAEPHRGLPAFPGGHVESYETSRQAAIRELEEETGLQVHDDGLIQLGTWDGPLRDSRGWYASVVYTAVLPEMVPVTGADDAARAFWTPLHLALRSTLAFDHGDILVAAAIAHGYSKLLPAFDAVN